MLLNNTNKNDFFLKYIFFILANKVPVFITHEIRKYEKGGENKINFLIFKRYGD
jgi:hypothetical protein